MTLQVRLVLRMLAEEPEQRRYGLEIVDGTGLLPGTIYPILARLEQAGWVDSEWEVLDESAARRPRRRYYRLTAAGETAAATAAQSAVTQRRQAGPRTSLGRALPDGTV